jgi:hypothetical protein
MNLEAKVEIDYEILKNECGGGNQKEHQLSEINMSDLEWRQPAPG